MYRQSVILVLSDTFSFLSAPCCREHESWFGIRIDPKLSWTSYKYSEKDYGHASLEFKRPRIQSKTRFLLLSAWCLSWLTVKNWAMVRFESTRQCPLQAGTGEGLTFLPDWCDVWRRSVPWHGDVPTVQGLVETMSYPGTYGGTVRGISV